MKNYIFLFLALLIASPAMAETVHLKNGQAVTGKILEKTAKSVKVDVGGTPMTYYADEVKDIDGTALAPAAVTSTTTTTTTTTSAAVSGGKRDLILKFIEVFGTRNAMKENLDAMLKTLPADDEQTKKLKANIKVDEIIDRLIPIYDKQFSEEDLKAFIEFYSSPAGRKLVSGIPVIMRDSIGISSEYFQEKFPEMKTKE